MRKTKLIKIDDLEITVKELRVKDIRQILDDLSEVSGVDDAIALLPLITDLPIEKFDDMAPSELNQVLDAAKEVNSFFLTTLEKTGIVKALKESVLGNLTKSFAESSKPGT